MAGPAPPFVFQWSTGAGGNVLQNVLPGAYLLTLTNSEGCDTTVTIMIGITSGDFEPGQAARFTATLNPNPATSTASLSVRGNEALKGMVTLYDAFGKALRIASIQGRDITIEFDVTELSAGTYFIGVFTDKLVLTRRFVKL